LQPCNTGVRLGFYLYGMPQAALAPALDLETRLLIVDDDPGIRELTAAFLSQHGYVVDTASGATEMRTLAARTIMH
jgi:ActR/RegA family two-component response regulator